MRNNVSALLAILVTAAGASAQDRSASGSRSGVRPYAPDALEVLNQRLEEVSLQDAPLDSVFDWINDLTPTNVVVRWHILEDAGVERDHPVTLNVRNLRLSQILWLILHEVGGTDLNLAYQAGEGLLIVSTEEDLTRELVVVVYDVSDLLLPIPRFESPLHADPSGVIGSGSGATGGILSSRGAGEDLPDETSAGEEEINELITLITETVEPDSWVVNGGTGSIRAHRNLLIVRNSIHVHQALGGYVKQAGR